MTQRQERFRRLYAEQFDPLLGYALRRVARAEDAADVVADVFLVAWRRLAALDGSRDWPLLVRIAPEGGYSDVFWGVADQLRRGDPVEAVRGGICS